MLRILLVEDSRDDADLVRFALEDAGLDFELLRVGDEAALREAVASFRPDAAISDLNLPGYSGLAALALLRELRPGMPLVLMTGGAVDCVPPVAATVLDKSDLARLPALLQGHAPA